LSDEFDIQYCGSLKAIEGLESFLKYKMDQICHRVVHRILVSNQLIHTASLRYHLKWTRPTKEANYCVRIMTYLPFLSLMINCDLVFL
jgi:hypothetical protein